MPVPTTDCQCKKWAPVPCDGRMTQEDLLCDTCRDSGCSLASFGPDFSVHVKITNWRDGMVFR